MRSCPILGCLLLACVVSLVSCERSTGLIRDSILQPTQLDTIQWVNSKPDTVKSIIENRKPVIIVGDNVPTKKWKALKWSPESISGDAVIGIKRYHKPKLTIGCCKLQPVSLTEFWPLVKEATTKGDYIYLNAPVSMLGKSLESDVGELFLQGVDPVRVGVWMGSAGSTAPLHHDPFDNFFVQVHGRKRFLLFPPEEYRNLYLYPKTGPRNRQAQVDLDQLWTDEIEAKYPNLVNARGIIVDVNPGDVMYLPPFWFHQVESLDDSISINAWYKSESVEAMDEAWEEGLPLMDEWTTPDLLVALKEMILRYVSATVDPSIDLETPNREGAKRFLQELVRTRFYPLFGDATGTIDHLKGIDTSEDPHLRVHLREQADLDANRFIPSSEFGQFSPGQLIFACSEEESHRLLSSFDTLGSNLNEAARNIASHFLKAPEDLRLLHLEDFVEDFVGQAVGDEFVYTYLQNCVLAKPIPQSKDEL